MGRIKKTVTELPALDGTRTARIKKPTKLPGLGGTKQTKTEKKTTKKQRILAVQEKYKKSRQMDVIRLIGMLDYYDRITFLEHLARCASQMFVD